MAYVNEMMETYGLSCDDKNKINVGTPAGSCYHQLSKLFLQGDAPQYYDHGFPYANSKIIPWGYLIMNNKVPPRMPRSRSLERHTPVKRQVKRTQSLPPRCSPGEAKQDELYSTDRLDRLHQPGKKVSWFICFKSCS